jgi:hypothetical protein
MAVLPNGDVTNTTTKKPALGQLYPGASGGMPIQQPKPEQPNAAWAKPLDPGLFAKSPEQPNKPQAFNGWDQQGGQGGDPSVIPVPGQPPPPISGKPDVAIPPPGITTPDKPTGPTGSITPGTASTGGKNQTTVGLPSGPQLTATTTGGGTPGTGTIAPPGPDKPPTPPPDGSVQPPGPGDKGIPTVNTNGQLNYDDLFNGWNPTQTAGLTDMQRWLKSQIPGVSNSNNQFEDAGLYQMGQAANTAGERPSVEMDPAIQAQLDLYRKTTGERLQNRANLMGVGTSTSPLSWMASGEGDVLSKAMQDSLARQEGEIARKTGAQQAFGSALTGQGGTARNALLNSLGLAGQQGAQEQGTNQAAFNADNAEKLRLQALMEQSLYGTQGQLIPSTLGATEKKW